jgi:tyrosyl-tRNA synthetase
VQLSDIEKMKQEAHPMQAKKELARRIVADFHTSEAATKAGEDWAKQFQKDEVPEEAERVTVRVELIEVQNPQDQTKPSSAYAEQPSKHLYLPDEKTVEADLKSDLRKVRIVRVEKLLLQLGLVSSATEGSRKLKEDAVTINGERMKGRYFALVSVPTQADVRVGRKLRIASIV